MSLAPCANAISETPRRSHGRESEEEAVVTSPRSPREVETASARIARVDRVFVACDVWVAEVDGTPAGFCAFRDGWLDPSVCTPRAPASRCRCGALAESDELARTALAVDVSAQRGRAPPPDHEEAPYDVGAASADSLAKANEKGRRSASLFCYRFRRLGTHKPAVAGNSNNFILTSRPCQASFPSHVQHNEESDENLEGLGVRCEACRARAHAPSA